MSYFAVAVVAGPKGWTASDLDLAGVSDAEDVADRLRDVDLEADVSLLFVEIDDEYLALLRLDAGEDLRVFGSDSAMAEESRLAGVLVADLKAPEEELDLPEAEDEVVETAPSPDQEALQVSASAAPDITPVGDRDILADLGVESQHLLALCTREATLPADVTTEICAEIGCADEVEELREA